MAIECGGCKRHVLPDHDGRLPPWCPFCGASLKAAATVPAPPPPRAVEPPSLPISASTAGSVSPTSAPHRSGKPTPEFLALDAAGPPEQVFHGSGWRRLVAWLVSFACFGLAAAIAYGVMHQPNKNPQSGMLLGGFFALGGLLGLYVALTLGEISYLVYRDGLVEKRGSDAKSVRWDQILEIYQTIHPAWTSYHIITGKGWNFELTGDIKNNAALGQIIEDRFIEARLPSALAELERGGTIRFGPLGVSKEALHFDMLSEGWNRVTMSVDRNLEPVQGTGVYSQLMHLHVYTQAQTKAYKVELGKVPNFALFMELAGRICPASVREAW
jgi:hypothetical protein